MSAASNWKWYASVHSVTSSAYLSLDIFTTECYSEVDGGGGPEQWNAQFVRDGLSGKVRGCVCKIGSGSLEPQVTSANIWIPEANPPPITFLNSAYNIVVCLHRLL
jgi:hypothetical protein